MSEAAPPLAESGLKNRFDRMEWAGAFGDLGTLIPFVVAYISVLKMPPFGVLFAFGLAMLACGLVYRTPFPVQPMKAIGAAAAIQASVTPDMIYVAALLTGVIWFTLGVTGWATRAARLVPATVVSGIVFGLGFGFMLHGLKMMQADWLVALIGIAGTLLLMRNRTPPAMFVLLAFGLAVGAWQHPALLNGIARQGAQLQLPSFALANMNWHQLLLGALLLSVPQIPLTLGNAVIATKEENNRLFPHRPLSEGRIALSTGIMNLFSAVVGGVPMCHGAGGMAGHIAFGARTGGAIVILGSLLLVLAFFFSGSVEMLFGLLPVAVLGVILFLTGAQLALGKSEFPAQRGERLVVLLTAALCVWNVGAGFVAGMALHHMHRRGWLGA
jgi:MFS superfamily sulfate permease-like transporter